MEYGYIRVSTKEQNIERQVSALIDFSINENNIYVDKLSGKTFERPAYRRLLKKLKKGDLLVAKSIDRLGRNYDEILEQWRIITKVKQADICIIDFPLLDTRSKDKDLTGTFIADLALQILSYVAQTEREFIHQRQAEGIACAKQRGVKFGRPSVEISAEQVEIFRQAKNGSITVNQAVSETGMSKSTFYRKIKDFNTEK